MAKYQSVNDETRYYPTLSLLVEPGAIVELPDGTEAAGLTVAVANKKSKAADAAEGVSE